MLNLIPTEHYEYSAADLIRGLLTVYSAANADPKPAMPIPYVGEGIPVRSGRVAIAMALGALGLRQGAYVGVPLYCCPVVLRAIKTSGLQPRFLDVDPRTFCLSPADLYAKRSKLDAVIAVHMFGNLCDMYALREAAPGVPLLEDCAQALGSRLGDRPAGSFGEVAAFSFRSGKYLSAGEGGAIYCNDAAIRDELVDAARRLPLPSRLDETMHVGSTYLRSLLRRRPLWGLVGTKLWELYNDNVADSSDAPLSMARAFRADLRLAETRMALLESMIQRQRRNADYYVRNLQIGEDALSLETPGSYFNRLQFPLLAPAAEDRDRMADALGMEGISTTRPYKDIASAARKHFGYAGDCPQSEDVAARVIVIPSNYSLRDAEVERIVVSVSRIWEKLGAHGTIIATSRGKSGSEADTRLAGQTDGVEGAHRLL